MSECAKGSEPGIGRCCCNCRHQQEVMKHPWNSGAAKGPITERMGFICKGEDDEIFVFFDREHGMCEMHDHKLP